MLAQHTRPDLRQAGSTPDRLDALAEDLITLNSEGDATRRRLVELGWPPEFLEDNEAAARRRANQRFVIDINTDRLPTGLEVEDGMVEAINDLLPPVQLIVAELQARGFTKQQIDLRLRRAMARAALGFAEHGGVH